MPEPKQAVTKIEINKKGDSGDMALV